MPQTVKASCPTCGDLSLPAELVTVVMYPRQPLINFYEFVCPHCKQRIQKDASPEIVLILSTVPTTRRVVDIPSEVLEDHPVLPAMTNDDVLDFMLDIQREDFLADSL